MNYTDAKFMLDMAEYFRNRPTNGEDKTHWANVYNAKNCERIAQKIGASEFKPTHRHIKTGYEYQVIGTGRIKTNVPLFDMNTIKIYRDSDGKLYACDILDFNEGKFEEMKHVIY